MESISYLELMKALIISCLALAAALGLARVLGRRNLFAMWLKKPLYFVVLSLSGWLFFWRVGLESVER